MKDNLKTSIKVKILLKGLVGKILLFTIMGSIEGYMICDFIHNNNINNKKIYTYKTVDPNTIEVVKPIIKKVKKRKEPVDYSKLTDEETIEYVQTPAQAQNYKERHFFKDWEKDNFYGETFKENHKDRRGLCIDTAISCAANLSDNDYPAYILSLKEKNRGRHALFLYRTDKGFGTLGDGYMDAKYKTINDLIKEYNNIYFYKDEKGNKRYTNYSSYFVVNLDELYPDNKWINGDIKEIFYYVNDSQKMNKVK